MPVVVEYVGIAIGGFLTGLLVMSIFKLYHWAFEKVME